MTRVRPIEIVRYFYSTSLDHIPLVRDLNSELEGYLSRERLNRELSDLERAHAQYESVPDEWISPDISREELLRLASQSPVPVLNRAGVQKTTWAETELLRKASDLKERRAEEQAKQEEDSRVLNPAPESNDQWFARLVLAAIPHPIFATDLNGHALFYNEGFQQRVLQRDFFHNNLALAEAYFLELTRGLLARVYSEGPHPADLLFASIPELSISVEITTIHREASISGYLYIFQDPELSGIPHEVLSRLERGMSLDEIMEELEAGIIASMLRRNGQNVSHAAQALRINRSTLQNKIKRLKVNERFARKVDGPVRRVRTSRDSSEDDTFPAEEGETTHGQSGGASVTHAGSSGSAKSGNRSKKDGGKTPTEKKRTRTPSEKKSRGASSGSSGRATGKIATGSGKPASPSGKKSSRAKKTVAVKKKSASAKSDAPSRKKNAEKKPSS